VKMMKTATEASEEEKALERVEQDTTTDVNRGKLYIHGVLLNMFICFHPLTPVM